MQGYDGVVQLPEVGGQREPEEEPLQGPSAEEHDEEQSDAAGEEDEEEEPGMRDDGPQPEDEEQVVMKLELFKCSAVQKSIQRLWDILPKDESGELPKQGYIDLNIGLQKALVEEFDLPAAVQSANFDWSQDVVEGQSSMGADDFAMFFFELCSLWCGSSVSLLVYLLFLNAVYIAVTEARGAHTVGLRPLEQVTNLPRSLFDLVAAQGWHEALLDTQLSAEDRFRMWRMQNLSAQAMEHALSHASHQVFQVTHDVRAALLFKERSEPLRGLEVMRQASDSLGKVSELPPVALGLPVTALLATGPARERELARARQARAPLNPVFPQRWYNPRSQAGKHQESQQSVSTALTLPAPAAARTKREKPSLMDALRGDLPPASGGYAGGAGADQTRAWIQQPPAGKAFQTRRARPPGGLVLAGQAAVAKVPASETRVPAARAASAGVTSSRPLGFVESEFSTGGQGLSTGPMVHYSQDFQEPTITSGLPPHQSARPSPATSRPNLRNSSFGGGAAGAAGGEIPQVPSATPVLAALGGMARFDILGSEPSMGSLVGGPSSQDSKTALIVEPYHSSAAVAETTAVAAPYPLGPAEIDMSSMLEPSLVKDSSLDGGEVSTHSLAENSKFLQESIISATSASEGSLSSKAAHRKEWGRGTHVLAAEHFSPPYQLPPKAPHLYRRQVDPIMLVRPQSILFGAHKWSKVNKMTKEMAFQRPLNKISEHLRPEHSAHAPPGPFTCPNEPVWHEMGHRLQLILHRQGKRAERRKKRRARQKTQRGRSTSTRPQKRDAGRELRDYLDRARMEAEGGGGGYEAPVRPVYIPPPMTMSA